MKELIEERLIINSETLPRVLIIGQTFTPDTGGGITLSNLFKNWPKNRLAIAVESKETLDFTRCSNYYRIGYDELKMPYPFSIFQRKTQSGLINEKKSVGAVYVKQTNPLKERLKQYFDNTLHFMGLFHWIYGNQKISLDFVSWVNAFNPDIIYYQPNSYKSLDFVLAVHEQVKVPLITHVMDDWFSFAIKTSPLKTFWQQKLDEKVRKLFAITQLHLSICSYMSDEYLNRYGYRFFPFHNSVNLNFWLNQHGVKNNNKPIGILYAGRIGYGINKMLLKVADVVEKMGGNGSNILLEIQTKDQRHSLLKKLSAYKHIKISKPIEYIKLPAKFAAADILLIPCDFDGPGVEFIRYSMPTKVSEYMATGTPILVVGPPETALTEYAKEGWAQVCSSDKADDIEAAIQELISSDIIKNGIVARAQELVVKNHDQDRIMNQFRRKVIVLSKATLTN